MSLIETINTDRLLGERINHRHFDDLRVMGRDRRVMRTLSADGNAVSDDVTQRFVNQHVDHWDRHGFGLWVFCDPQDGCYVGRGGLHHCRVLDSDEIEVAYALMPEYWGKGLATEIAKASVAVAFNRLRIRELISFTLKSNRASQRVMEKVGFAYDCDGIHTGLPHVFYRLRVADWRALSCSEIGTVKLTGNR